MIRTRFAPSPNGSLHLGHAYAAIVAHDLAREANGEFLVRIEDIDGDRSRPEFADQALRDLDWLGLGWDGPVIRQSSRLERYAEAGEQLKAMGLLYPCLCTRAEIIARASADGPDGPVYPGTCRDRNVDRAPDGPALAWRLDMSTALALAGSLTWTDALAGARRAAAEAFGDVVLLRRGLPASYHLSATLDDAASGITLVTRGEDLFAATDVHRLLQALLGLPTPVWHHHALLVEADPQGGWRKLAKRRGSPALADLRSAGVDGRKLADSLRARRFPAGITLGHDLPSSL